MWPVSACVCVWSSASRAAARGSTVGIGDASALVKVALSLTTPRVVIACILLHRDDRIASKACARFHLLGEGSSS